LHLSVAKRGYASNSDQAEVIQCRSLQARKPTVDGRLLLRFHDAISVGRGLHALQPLTLPVVSVRTLSVDARARVRRYDCFCLVFGKKFNIMSTFSFTNRSPCRKKTILAKVGFGAKRVSVCMQAK